MGAFPATKEEDAVTSSVDLAKKLQLPARTSVFVVNPPQGFHLDAEMAKGEEGAAILVFAVDSKQLKANCKPAVRAAKEDRPSWVAYPKAGQLGTDLSRDRLVQLMRDLGVEGVRLVSIDDVWSAMRFRPH